MGNCIGIKNYKERSGKKEEYFNIKRHIPLTDRYRNRYEITNVKEDVREQDTCYYSSVSLCPNIDCHLWHTPPVAKKYIQIVTVYRRDSCACARFTALAECRELRGSATTWGYSGVCLCN